MTTADDAKVIRQTIKKKYGYTSKQVSVRSRTYSMGASIDVRIRDPFVDRDAVEAVANQQKSVDRCEITGEIMSGGNQFVFVEWDGDAKEKVAALFPNLIAELMSVGKQAQSDKDMIYEVDKYSMGEGWRGFEIRTDWNSHEGAWFNPDYESSVAAALLSLGLPETDLVLEAA